MSLGARFRTWLALNPIQAAPAQLPAAELRRAEELYPELSHALKYVDEIDEADRRDHGLEPMNRAQRESDYRALMLEHFRKAGVR